MAKAKVQTNVDPDLTAEVFAEYVSDMAEIGRIKQRIGTRLLRYDQAGGDSKAIKASYRLSNMDDPATHMRSLMTTARVLQIIPTETEEDGQSNFLPAFKPPSKAALAKLAYAKIRVDGYNSGLSGGERGANPNKAGSEQFAVWDKAWAEGAEDLAAKPKKDGGEKAPTENRRGRRNAEPPATSLEADEAAYRAKGVTVN